MNQVKNTQDFSAVIGLEIHAQLNTKAKLFSPEGAGWLEGENNQIHPVSLALPGTLPVLNEKALEMALKTGKAFKGKLSTTSVFARKNYFYPDLPKGYQISQYDKPFCEGGRVEFFLEDKKHTVALERIHLEEDAGQSLHKDKHSLINFNRAGTALLEIVTQPVITKPKMASACAKAIRRLLRYLEVCDGNLEEGSLRCDCNVSVRPKGETKLGTKVELKNINSFRFIEKALVYEIDRQIECLKNNILIKQETRLYDSSKNQTLSMRSKETASDYRYFPDPDLPELSFKLKLLEQITYPELPFDRSLRFQDSYKLSVTQAESLIEDKSLADYFEDILKQGKMNPETLYHWFNGELKAHLKTKNQKQCPIPAKDFYQLLSFLSQKEISNTMAKEVFLEMWDKGLKPEEIIKTRNLKQISDSKVLEELVKKVLSQNPDQIRSYKQGKNKLFGFFVGQVMKLSKGQANPQKVSQIIKQKLEEPCELPE